MQPLQTLIKITNDKLDKARKQMVLYETEHAKLEGIKDGLERSLVKEEGLIKENPEFAYSYGLYAETVRRHCTSLTHNIAKVDEEIKKMQEVIYFLFTELKRYEIALEHKEQEELDKQSKQENNELDEIAINRYIRDDNS